MIDVVVGGQAGSEGKGAVSAHLIRSGDYEASVRPGSSNAGHTVYSGGEEFVHQVLPVAITVSEKVDCYMAPESSFGLDEFFEEAKDPDRIYIDPKAAIITEKHRKTEREKKLGEDIGSTVHGCGAVRVDKIWRSAGNLKLAEQYSELSKYICENRVPDQLLKQNTLIEGTQGTFLSMNQSPHWPYCTSRDCIASSFLSSCGLPPSCVRDVWTVFRTYPIRVGGKSGPMEGKEISFEEIARRAGHENPPVEFTSVTNKKRRIFEWSTEQFKKAVRLNDPDKIAITFLDYLDVNNFGASKYRELTKETKTWIEDRRTELQKFGCEGDISLLKTGPKPEHTIDLT